MAKVNKLRLEMEIHSTPRDSVKAVHARPAGAAVDGVDTPGEPARHFVSDPRLAQQVAAELDRAAGRSLTARQWKLRVPHGDELTLPARELCAISLESFGQARARQMSLGRPFVVAAVTSPGHAHFYLAEALDGWLKQNQRRNPATNKPFHSEQLLYFGELRRGGGMAYLGSSGDFIDRTRRGLFINLCFMASQGSAAARLCLDTVMTVGDKVLEIPAGVEAKGARMVGFAPPSLADAQRATLLAVRGGHERAVHALAERFPVTPDADFLRMAIAHSRLSLVRWASEQGADLEGYIAHSRDLGLDTDFHPASASVTLDVRPLSYAAHMGDEKMVEALLQQGAVVDARDSEGYTAQHYAKSHPNVRRCLEEYAHQVGERPASARGGAPETAEVSPRPPATPPSARPPARPTTARRRRKAGA